jgi:glycine hydroxymethyltransferase
VARAHGARLLFDAAHLSGPIAGGVWPNPLAAGADLMTMSTYKSLGGPAGGLLVTNDAELAERVDRIAFPGLTANFDAGTTAALAVTLAEWLDDGPRRAELMTECAGVLADALADLDVPSFVAEGRATRSHAFAIDARSPSCWTGGGTAAARHLGSANLLCSAIGLPSGLDDGLRIGTNELVQLGASADDMAPLADLVARALRAERPADLTTAVAAFRARLD